MPWFLNSLAVVSNTLNILFNIDFLNWNMTLYNLYGILGLSWMHKKENYPPKLNSQSERSIVYFGTFKYCCNFQEVYSEQSESNNLALKMPLI